MNRYAPALLSLLLLAGCRSTVAPDLAAVDLTADLRRTSADPPILRDVSVSTEGGNIVVRAKADARSLSLVGEMWTFELMGTTGGANVFIYGPGISRTLAEDTPPPYDAHDSTRTSSLDSLVVVWGGEWFLSYSSLRINGANLKVVVPQTSYLTYGGVKYPQHIERINLLRVSRMGSPSMYLIDLNNGAYYYAPYSPAIAALIDEDPVTPRRP